MSRVFDAANYCTSVRCGQLLNEASLNIGGCFNYADYEGARIRCQNCYSNEESLVDEALYRSEIDNYLGTASKLAPNNPYG